MPVRRVGVVWLAAAAALFWAAGRLASVPYAALPRFERPAMEETAVTDMSLALAGARRFGADLAFIQMLQYYAEPTEGAPPAAGGAEVHVHDAREGHSDVDPTARLAVFPRLREHILRAAALDPYFHYAYLFGAGALAFNLNRSDEALDLLRRGSAADPRFWRYRLYAGAIAYRNSAEPEKVVALLEEAMRYPDCPTMLMNILANLHKKRGDYRRAAEIYEQIVAASRDDGYVQLAVLKLEGLRPLLAQDKATPDR
jgi:tetratricopeptide (TPR) repeat protein